MTIVNKTYANDPSKTPAYHLPSASTLFTAHLKDTLPSDVLTAFDSLASYVDSFIVPGKSTAQAVSAFNGLANKINKLAGVPVSETSTSSANGVDITNVSTVPGIAAIKAFTDKALNTIGEPASDAVNVKAAIGELAGALLNLA